MVTDVLRPRLNSELNNYFFHYSMITYAGHIVETKSKNEKKINYDCRTNKRRHWEVFSLRTLSLDVSYYFFPDGTAAYMYMHTLLSWLCRCLLLLLYGQFVSF